MGRWQCFYQLQLNILDIGKISFSYEESRNVGDRFVAGGNRTEVAGVLAAAAPTSENLPPDIHMEIDALAELDDGALWKIARSIFPATRRRRYDELLEKNGAGRITPDEREELKNLRLESERLMLRKAHAYALLRWRGHVLPRLADLPRPR